MHPYLFDVIIFGHHLRPPTYGFMLALAFSVGYFLCLRRTRLIGENLRHVENLFLLTVLGSVIGSRLFHVLFEEFDYYAAHPNKIIAVWEGGYTFYGALLLGLLFIYLYSRGKKINFLAYGDIGGPSTMLGLAIGRIGCFLAGCCWGRPTSMPWGVVFNDPDTFCTVRGVPVHPTQLYESLGAFLIFLYVEWRFKKRQYDGQIFFHTLILYSILRFIIEFYRGDDVRGYVFHGLISYSQLVSLFVLPLAVGGMLKYSKKKQPATKKKTRKSKN